LISSRSNSARPPNTVSMSLPAGVVVSAQGSAKDLNRHPLSAICLIVVSRSAISQRRFCSVRALRRDRVASGQWVQDNFSTHEFVRWLQPANTCDVTALERGPVALTDVARVSTILIRGGYLIRQSTLGKTMATDDKKTSPAPKNGAVEKKAVAAKKDEGQPKDKTTPDADRSKAESGEKAAGSPTGYSRGEGQKPVSKAYRDNWNAIFGNKKKKKR
jgi:hypothetical protein